MARACVHSAEWLRKPTQCGVLSRVGPNGCHRSMPKCLESRYTANSVSNTIRSGTIWAFLIFCSLCGCCCCCLGVVLGVIAVTMTKDLAAMDSWQLQTHETLDEVPAADGHAGSGVHGEDDSDDEGDAARDQGMDSTADAP